MILAGILFSGCSTKHVADQNSSINYQSNIKKDFHSNRNFQQNTFFVKIDAGVVSRKVDALISNSTGNVIISCSRDKTVRAFDAITGQELRKYLWNISDGAGTCNDIALSHDDKFLAIAVKGSKQLFIYNFQSAELIKTISVDSDISAISISSDNKYIVTAHKNKVVIWDYASSKSSKIINHEAVDVEIIKIKTRYLVAFVADDENLFLSTLKGKGYLTSDVIFRYGNGSTEDIVMDIDEYDSRARLNYALDFDLMELPSSSGRTSQLEFDMDHISYIADQFNFKLRHIAYNKQKNEIAVASNANNVVWVFSLEDKIDPINVSEMGTPLILKGFEDPEWLKFSREQGMSPAGLTLSAFYLNFNQTFNTKTKLIANLNFSKEGEYLAVDSWEAGTCEEIYKDYSLVNDLSGDCQSMWPTTFITNNRLVGIGHDSHFFQYLGDNHTQNELINVTSKTTIKPKLSIAFNGNYLAWGSKFCKVQNSGFFDDGFDENCLDLENSIDLNSLQVTDGIDKSDFKRVSESNNTYTVKYGPGDLYERHKTLTYQLKNDRSSGGFKESFSVAPESGWTANTFGVTNELIISGNKEGHLIGYALSGNNKAIHFIGHSSTVQSVSIVGSTLVSSDLSGEILLWKIPPATEMSEQEHIKVFPVFTFLIDDNGEYIVVSDDGYFAGSYALLDKVWLHINSKSNNKQARHMKLNQFYDVFYRPDIVLARLQRLDNINVLKPVSMAEAIHCPPPEVLNLSAKRKSANEVNISYSIKDTGGGIGDVRVYINGKLTHIDTNTDTSLADPAEMNQAMASSDISQRLRGLTRIPTNRASKIEVACNTSTTARKKGVLTLKTISGENKIQVAAFNAKNNIQSVLKETVFLSDAPIRKTRVYALAVGIDRYANQDLNLQYSAIDAQSIEQLLKEQLSGVYDDIEVVSLIDNDATKENIINELDKIKQKALPNDVFILFIASHGEVADQFYIITHDYAKLDGSFDDSSWLSSKQLLDKLQEISAQKQLVMLDTCHSGALNDIVSNFYDARMSAFTHKAGLTMLSSTKAFQQAIDNYKGNGLLTHLLKLSFQSKPDKDNNNDITVHEIADEIQNQYIVIDTGVKSMQQPSASKFGVDFIVDRL